MLIIYRTISASVNFLKAIYEHVYSLKAEIKTENTIIKKVRVKLYTNGQNKKNKKDKKIYAYEILVQIREGVSISETHTPSICRLHYQYRTRGPIVPQAAADVNNSHAASVDKCVNLTTGVTPQI